VPAAAPQWRQKRAPGWRGCRQAAQVPAPASEAPQLLQKRPEALAPQPGHLVVAVTDLLGV
jgi:hypothetical protein